MIKKLEQKIFLKLYNFSRESSKVAKIAVLITIISAKFFAVVYFLVVGWLIYNQDPRLNEFVLLPAVVFLLTKLIPYFYNRQRPFAALKFKSLIEQRRDHSFPSNHSGSAFIIALMILQLNFWGGLVLLAAAILTAFSRIMVGVHYPLDILGAVIIAFLVNLIGIKLF